MAKSRSYQHLSYLKNLIVGYINIFWIILVKSRRPLEQCFVLEEKNKSLEFFRKRKKELKAARKALLKAGLQGSPEEVRISKEWFQIVRQHNKLRVALSKKDAFLSKLSAERAFKKDPNKFAAKIFNQTDPGGSPEFSAAQAEEYFVNTYRDKDRNYSYSAPPGLSRPQLPVHFFAMRCPTMSEIDKSVRKKRNAASPGLNGIPYIAFKKCASLRHFIFKLGKKIWQTQDVPANWAEAFITLLFKGGNLSNVTDFRPIAITSTAGKIFFSILSDKLQIYLTKNNYISKSVQKGFLSGVSGCLEHSFALMEALKEAKTAHRQIVVSWLDLANAYGSVRHNLIQFALNWYHVPPLIQKIIFDYYEKLCAMVVTRKWSTGFFLFDIGLFQGCVLSTILFDCVFQLLLDLLKPINSLGYTFKSAPQVTSLVKAYADDLTLVTRNVQDNQIAIDKTHFWLSWTKTMSAKSSKCVCLAFKMFHKATSRELYKPISDTMYSAFDPCLVIDNQPIRFLINPKEEDVFKSEHFKFLGRWINGRNLSEEHIKTRVKTALLQDFSLIEQSKINGFMKLWLYQFYVLSHLSWPFLSHDFDRSFVSSLQSLIGKYLKRWAGISKSADTGVLFRSKDNFGLGLTSILDHFIKMQLIKYDLFQNSPDDSIRTLISVRIHLEEKNTRAWKPTKLSKSVNAEVDLDLKFPSQSNQSG